MKALGIFLTKVQTKEKMIQVDKDGSGNIDKQEFTALMAQLFEQRNQDKEIVKVFRVYDDDDNGLISVKNVGRCARDLDEDLTIEEM